MALPEPGSKAQALNITANGIYPLVAAQPGERYGRIVVALRPGGVLGGGQSVIAVVSSLRIAPDPGVPEHWFTVPGFTDVNIGLGTIGSYPLGHLALKVEGASGPNFWVEWQDVP